MTRNVEKVTVLGLGPMGQALTGALLDAGYAVTVWNRTPSKADNVVERGAVWADDPRKALSASEVTLVNVVDHDAVDALVTSTAEQVRGSVIVGLSSDTPVRARGTASLIADAGGRYLDGAIMSPTDTIGTPRGRLLFAGPREIFDAHSDLFAALGESSWLGDDHGRAAAFDMSLLDLFWTSVAGFLHAVAVARENAVEPGELLHPALGIVEILPPIFTELVERIESDRHGDSNAPVSSLAASVRHLVSTSRDARHNANAQEGKNQKADHFL